jgi:hypothetical protein
MSVLQQIAKAGKPVKKSLTDLTPEEEFRISKQKESIDARRKAGQEYAKASAKEEEHTPKLYEYAPANDDAQAYLNLVNKKRDLALRIQRQKKEDELAGLIYQNKEKGITARETIKNIISIQPGKGNINSNLDARTIALENHFNSFVQDLRDNLRTRWSGFVQNKELGYEIVRYLKDGQVKNKALEQKVAKLAGQWTKVTDRIKTLRNKNGARIGTLEDWVIPQGHDKIKMKKAGKDAWMQQIKTRLDIPRIEKEQNANIDKILNSAYDNIVGRKVDTKKGAKSQLAKANEFERVLHFRTGDDIIEYNKAFGNEDIFSVMDTHIRSQANEIAQLQLLGPNPDLTYENLKQFARQEGMGRYKEEHLDRIWNVATGKADANIAIDTLDTVLGGVGGTHRSIQIASKLGSAMISSIADVSNIIVSAGYRDLNSFKVFGKGIHTILQEAITIGKVGKNTELAARIGVVSEFASAAITNNRYAEMGTGWSQRRAENVLRASGLNAWTNSLRVGFALELSANLAENATKSFNDLPFKRMLEEYGISDFDWDIIRNAPMYERDGAKFIDVNNIIEVDEELGLRVGEMINEEMNAMIIAPTSRIRAITTWGAEKGTFAGEAARNMFLFRTFPITVLMVHLNRMSGMSGGNKLGYTAKVLVSGVVFGSIALWLKDIAKGETPRDPLRPAMIAEALVQSGGLGILGDVFLGEQNTRYGHSWTATAIGVPASTLEDIGKTVMDITAPAVGYGEWEQKDVANAFNRAANYIPGKNLWYTRLLTEKAIDKFVRENIDPDYFKKKRKKEKALRLRGQEFIFE